MKKLGLYFGLNFLIVWASAQTQAEFEDMLSQINADSLKKTVQDLQNFGNRFCDNSSGGNKNVALYLVNRLKNYGIGDAKIDSFHVQIEEHWLLGNIDRYMYNVAGRIFGESGFDSTIIIGAHLDAISLTEDRELLATSPGADDNASGVAIMIEMARIFHKNNIKPKYNIDFMAYDAEEIGLFGSFYDAEKRKNAGEKIMMMINNDMVSNQPLDSLPWKLNFVQYDNSLNFNDKAMNLCAIYTVLTPHKLPDEENEKSTKSSDSYAYYFWGFQTVYSHEHTFSPHYHSVNDVIENCNFEYMKEVGRMNFALLYHYAVGEIFDGSICCVPYLPNVQVFPNPTTNEVWVQCYSDMTVDKIEIYDITGRLLDFYDSSLISNLTMIDFRSFQSGVYVMKIYTSYGIKNKKIVKQ